MGRPLRRRKFRLNDWQTNLDRSYFAVDASCTFALGRLDGAFLPSSRSIACYALVGQAKNHSSTHPLSNAPHEMFRQAAQPRVLRHDAFELNPTMSTMPTPPSKPYKIPRSTLIVIYNERMEVLLIERADRPGYWQSVTGSQDEGESLLETATREVMEETGIEVSRHALTDWQIENVYEIYPIWRHRYAPGVTHNTEHVFGLRVRDRVAVSLSAHEHLQYVWLPVELAAPLCFSPTNRDAILSLTGRGK
jgi:dATP pyrophosphohydrolase